MAAAVLAASTNGGSANDRYYVPRSPSGDLDLLLFDQPLSLDLARCYGRYQALGHDYVRHFVNDATVKVSEPSDLEAREKRVGALLIETAQRERGEKVALDTLVDVGVDEAGQLIPTGAPSDVYDAYSRGKSDPLRGVDLSDRNKPAQAQADLMESRAPDVFRSCGALVASTMKKRKLGPAREALFTGNNDTFLHGEPRVLAVARCYGRLSSVEDYLDRAAENESGKAHDYYYPKDLAGNTNSLAKLLTVTAARDRDEAVAFPTATSRTTFPADVADAINAGAGDVGGFDFRPDFWYGPADFVAEDILRESEADRASCAELVHQMQPVSK